MVVVDSDLWEESVLRGEEIMRKGRVIGVVMMVGLVILLKVFQHSIPRITNLLSNIIMLTIFVLLAIIYGTFRLRKARCPNRKPLSVHSSIDSFIKNKKPF